jgi:hypothetical protein
MHGLIDLVDFVLECNQARTGKCAVEFSDAYQNASWCGATSATFCGECGTEVCQVHAIPCCTLIYCPACYGIHQTHHEWLLRQPEFCS